MSDRWCLLNSSAREKTESELRSLYGEHALFTRVGQFNLIHLDSPSPEEIARRVSEFDPEELFDDDCPICQMLRNEHCDVIYDGSLDEENDELDEEAPQNS
ncbi:MAG TPA: hypothetical protein PLP42_17055 [Acidobacteriota bacterium]|nr:hypothetical protein [Acidobacteriota bacterium]